MCAATVQRTRIFVSYRRQDAQHAAGRLAADLRAHFGHDQVFEDIASIAPGADFMDALRDGLANCAAIIVVIGPKWVTLADRQGRRRIDLADDWVRQEVAYGLQQQGVRVFPVLVDDADMPRAEELPEDLRPLTRRQAAPVTVRHWAKDVSLMFDHLKRIPGLDRAPNTPVQSPTNEQASSLDELPDRKASSDSQTSAAPRSADRGETRKSWFHYPIAIGFPALLLIMVLSRLFSAGNKDCDVCPEMVVIPAGSFEMGSPANEEGREGDEGPQHKVSIPVSFSAGKFEVTFDEWDACVRQLGCDHNPGDQGWGRGMRPVINVSWNDAKQYVKWLSTRTGRIYRLLSEAEWEYMARAGTATPFNTGVNVNPNQANYDTSQAFAGSVTTTARKQTVTAGTYQANAFGLYDVHGNVWEWTEDCWNASYVGAPGDGSARMTADCERRVIRGGSWNVKPQVLRSAFRSGDSPDDRGSVLGFRVAKTL